MEGGKGGGGGYSVPDGLQLSSFSSVSQLSAADGRTNAATEDSRSEEKKRMEKGEAEIRQLLRDIFPLANYYLVFQGVIFTSIFGNPSPLKCQYRWLPVSLSLIAGLLNLSILIHLTRKYDRLTYERELDLAGVGGRQVPPILSERRESRQMMFMICFVLFVLFLVILLFGSWKILCYHSGFPQSCNIKNCFEVCNDAGRCILICLSTS
ncbi:unnamed protein product [Coffea canephora]|uniref:Transmembrane protein n=1 Tax=Coffea canephora TaxID=49390 RepID=A0A068U5W4_COFCA|nr:unnamed protein product [Coffea canephora]